MLKLMKKYYSTFIYGIRPLIEAIQSGVRIYKILMKKRLNNQKLMLLIKINEITEIIKIIEIIKINKLKKIIIKI